MELGFSPGFCSNEEGRVTVSNQAEFAGDRAEPGLYDLAGHDSWTAEVGWRMLPAVGRSLRNIGGTRGAIKLGWGHAPKE